MPKNQPQYTNEHPPVSALRQVNEAERLEALHNYQVLDTAPEKVFNDLVRLAAYICGTPISLVSLIDEDRQWFKARVGLEIQTTSRDLAFCRYAMLADDVYEVADASKDPLFRENPLVLGDPNIRFYAGASLVTPEGQPLGTLCAIDSVPRQLTEEQREALRILAREVVAHLELRRAKLQLEQEKEKLTGLLQMANDKAQSLYLGSRTEIFIKQEYKLIRVLTADINYVEALGDYVNLYTLRERYTIYTTMKELEAKLPSRDFARVHRKYIVRLDRIMAIEADSLLIEADRAGAERVGNSVTIPIGNSYKTPLLNRLNLV